MQIYEDISKCYGCGKCALECPVDAIKMAPNEEGFLYPLIDQDMCIECGRCKTNCVGNLAETNEITIDEVYACCNSNPEVLANSTSGGVFYVLAEDVLRNNGVVFGAAYEGLHVTHIRVDKEEELCRLQGSKYVQSDITGVLAEVGKDIASGRRVLFSGTPCQIAAVRMLVGENDSLLCAEIACMGCPSPLVWEKYMDEYQEKRGAVDEVKFRDKCTGWNGSSISYISKNDKKSFRHNEDIYMQAFGQALFYRPSCHDCGFKGKNSLGDIKIGDFWGIGNYKEKYKQKNGVSVVITQTQRGKEAFFGIAKKLEVEVFPYNVALAYNEYFELSKQPSKHRNEFFDSFNKGKDLEELIYSCLYPEVTDKEIYWCQYPVAENLLRLSLSEQGILEFFKKNKYDRVAIYGLGNFGQLIVKILKKAGVNVCVLVDRNYQRFPEYLDGVKVVGLHQVAEEEVDCIVVTLVHIYNNVLELLMVQGIDINKVISVGSIV